MPSIKYGLSTITHLLSAVPATIPRVVLALCGLMVSKSFLVSRVLARWEMETFRCGSIHFIVKGGFRNFADVVSYLRNPIILVLEVLFLVVVTTHAMLGVRAIVMDFGLSDRAEKRLGQLLTVVGVLTVAYGLWLTWVIVH